MQGEVGPTLHHAIIGSVAGVICGLVSNEITKYAETALNKTLTTSTGKHVVHGIIGGTSAALVILAGDRILDATLTSTDPLYRMFFYQTAFAETKAWMGFGKAFKSILPSNLATKSDCNCKH